MLYFISLTGKQPLGLSQTHMPVSMKVFFSVINIFFAIENNISNISYS